MEMDPASNIDVAPAVTHKPYFVISADRAHYNNERSIGGYELVYTVRHGR